MHNIRLLSWNVNGLRAIYKKGFCDWVMRDMPDVLCLQETKVQADQIPSQLKSLPGYFSYFCSGDKKGYGGVALYSREEPKSVKFTLDIEGLDDEHRAILADYGDFLLFNVYFPNGKASKERLEYKLRFYDLFLDHIDQLKAKGRKIVICGDINTAHKEIDLARPKANEKISGFLPDGEGLDGPAGGSWLSRHISYLPSRRGPLLLVGFEDASARAQRRLEDRLLLHKC